jgi:hypothetical protein
VIRTLGNIGFCKFKRFLHPSITPGNVQNKKTNPQHLSSVLLIDIKTALTLKINLILKRSYSPEKPNDGK